MALDKSALLELTEALRSADDGQLMRKLLHTILQALIDAEATEHIGADPHERTDARTTYRNGTRNKTVSTTSGDLTVKIAKTRTGSFFPSLLSPRRRIDVALHAVVMEAYVHGVSTRKVDDLVTALGAESGISKSEVSRICAELDTDVAGFNNRDLGEQGLPYVFLDATFCRARVGGDQHGKGARVVSQAVVIATGVSADGRREVLGAPLTTPVPPTPTPLARWLASHTPRTASWYWLLLGWWWGRRSGSGVSWFGCCSGRSGCGVPSSTTVKLGTRRCAEARGADHRQGHDQMVPKSDNRRRRPNSQTVD